MTAGPVRLPQRFGVEAVGIAVLAVIAVVAVGLVVQPFGPSLHDPDAAASVLFFDRIAAGNRLEAFVPTTPKPLLTLLYGAAWNATGDWRLLGLLTLAAFGVAIATGAALLLRVAGRPAAAFIVVAFVASSTLTIEVAHANSVVWALAAWGVVGLAVTAGPRRSWVAGLALAAAASFRNETFVLVGVATLGVVVLAALRWQRPRPAPGTSGDARAWSGVLLGWLALPLAAVHSQLLTGDAWAWLSVPAGYTALTTPDLRPTSPLAFASEVIDRYATEPILLILAAIGIVWLVRQRQWALTAGLLGLTAGIVALIGFVAWRGTYVTPRYFEQVELGLVVAAAVGAGALILEAQRFAFGGGAGRRWTRAAPLAGVVAAAALALLVVAPPGPFDAQLSVRLVAERGISANAGFSVPILRDRLAAETSPVPSPIQGPRGLSIVDPATATLIVPRPLWTRLAVELDAPLTRLADSWLAFRDRGVLESVRPGQTVFHDRVADTPRDLYLPLEATSPPSRPGVRLASVFSDAVRGLWILSVEPQP